MYPPVPDDCGEQEQQWVPCRGCVAAARDEPCACAGGACCVRHAVPDEPWQYGCTVCDPQLVQRGTADMCDEHRDEFYAMRRDGAL